jgi:hypothetical protein
MAVAWNISALLGTFLRMNEATEVAYIVFFQNYLEIIE